MINKIILACYFWGYLLINIWAQVGINTLTPQGTLHIHVGNNASTNNDIIISNNGNVGIHTMNPQAKLDLRGTLRVTAIPNIPIGEKHLIAAESDGTFTTLIPGQIPTVQGNIPSNLSSLPSLPMSGASVNYSGISITLPKGRWVVYYTATHSINGKVASVPADAAVIKWELINNLSGSNDGIHADYSTAGFINSFVSTMCFFLVDNQTNNTTNSNVTYYIRGSATTQNSLSFVYTANLWAEFYTE